MIHIQDRGSHIFIRYEGAYEYAQVESMVLQVKELNLASGVSRVLMDVTQMHGFPNTMQSYQISLFALAKLMGKIKKAALVYRPDNFHQFTENVFVNRGANVRAFTDPHAALHWLLSEGERST